MSEHYYTENPTSEIQEKLFQSRIKGITVGFKSVSGVFSFENRIDKVSELLIENFEPSGASVLDIGCGYGAIGLCIKALFPDQAVTMSDVNNRAVEYSKINAKNNNLDVKVIQGNLYNSLSGQLFSDIVSNPPFAAGKKLLEQMIIEARNYLMIGGALWLVAHHNKGGSTLKEMMKNTFGNVQDVEKSGGIRVYKSLYR